jgi:hypothetical protein
MATKPVGRPPKYKKEFCQELITHMANGNTFASFGHIIKVARNNMNVWVTTHPEWAEAKELGESARAKFTEDLLIDIAKTGRGNAACAIFMAKNLGGGLRWTEKNLESESTQYKIMPVFGQDEED